MIEIYLLAIPVCFLITFFVQFFRLGFFKSVLISLLIAVTWPVSLTVLILNKLFRPR
ncbi:GhoT/OrtT family toxin [Actinobacillus genomosp. 1]|uniref:GhoT/OrtT family toxin n=1 Tax=Actinobacillus genomosp. 1 TaxID=254839 RepID=UPI002442D53D|nr:GhoT/OrtT family toxin [Actinobacillus genomosp. 1]WGE35317.1 GhoT/OrtT family toxin [Actinobacillus genomosp. 1]WGE90579.1 GhoT/OrtT family toxin [Actinobacillus genomosp. 1]